MSDWSTRFYDSRGRLRAACFFLTIDLFLKPQFRLCRPTGLVEGVALPAGRYSESPSETAPFICRAVLAI